MPLHEHTGEVGDEADGLTLCFQSAHQRYQHRFQSYPDYHLSLNVVGLSIASVENLEI